MRGGNAIGKTNAAKAHLRHSHAALFKAFVRRSKHLFGFADTSTKPLLKPHLVRHEGNRQPLAKYGMRGNFSQLPFQINLGDTALYAALCSYGSKVPCIARIPLRLRSARFHAPKFAPWQHLAKAPILPEAGDSSTKRCLSNTLFLVRMLCRKSSCCSANRAMPRVTWLEDLSTCRANAGI